MGSIVRTGGSNIDRSADLRGLSIDIKPTKANGDNVPHGSTWYNMDDCTRYMYNADNDTWYNIPNGGGGTGDMQKSVYDPTNAVANAGGIDSYVGSEIDNAITEVEGNIAPIANNLIDDTVGWTNKNLLPITLDQLKAINTSGTWEDNVYTYNGITITVDIFNNLITGINVNGANTAGSVVFKLTDNFVYQFLSEDKYYISDGVDTTAIVSGSAYISVERKKGESGESHYLNTNNEERSVEFTVDYTTYDYYFVNIYIPNNSSINNAVFYPMIRRASISDDTYEPYTKTVKDEIFGLNSSVGNLASRVGIAEGNITTLNEIKANKSDLGTASSKNSTSVVTDSTDLVESGAVKDIVGWGNKNLLPKKGSGTSSNYGVTFTVDSDGVITANGTATGENAQVETQFTALYDEMVILNGCDSGDNNIHLYPWCYTDNARPYADATKTNRLTPYDNVYNGNSISFYIERGKNYGATCRVMNGSTANNQLFYPMVSKNGGEYEPYHESVSDSLDDKLSYADNGILGAKNIDRTKYKSVIQDGINWVVNADNTITISGTNSSTGSNQNPNDPDNAFIAPFSAQVILTGGISPQCNLYPWDFESNTRPWKDSSKTERVTGNVESPTQEMSFWMEKGKKYSITLRVVGSYQIPGQLTYKPMIRLATDSDPTYQLYAQTNRELTVNKADNSVIGTTENGSTASKDYAVGDYFIKDTILGKTKAAIASGGTFTKDTNYEETDVAKELTELYKYIGILTTPVEAFTANSLPILKRNITNAFYNGSLRGEIAAGNFKNVRPGDYIIGQATGSTYYVAECDYWLGNGDSTNGTTYPAYNTHHLGLMLFKPVGTTALWRGYGYSDKSWRVSASDLGRCPWNAETTVDPTDTEAIGSNSTNITRSYNGTNMSAYMGSFIRERIDAILLPQCFQADFGSANVLKRRNWLSNAINASAASGARSDWQGIASGSVWVDRFIDLASEVELYGSRINSSSRDDIGVQNKQLPIYRNGRIHDFYPRMELWTKGIASAPFAAYRYGGGNASANYASSAIWACPLGCVK